MQLTIITKSFILTFFVAFCIAGCGGKGSVEDAELRQRANQFGFFLQEMKKTGLSKEELKDQLREFIEPTSDREERINKYYSDFVENPEMFEIVEQSVERIKVAPDGKSAVVTYRTAVYTRSAGLVTFYQDTDWNLLDDGQWYRTTADSRKSLR